jgi:hypothetical protein
VAALREFDRAGLHSYVPKAVLLTQAYPECMTAPGFELDHRPDRKNENTTSSDRHQSPVIYLPDFVLRQ